jgi:transposase
MKKAELRRMNTKPRNAEAVKGTQATEAPREPRAGLSFVDKPPVADKPSRVEAPDPEVPEKAERRRFSVEYKRSILAQADDCRSEGAIGALLRREGLYSSHLTTWRRQREEGTLAALSQKRGRKSKFHPLAAENARLKAENERLAHRLEQAETIIEVQKKVSTLFGIPPSEIKPTGKNS